jgi:hypothetical protein
VPSPKLVSLVLLAGPLALAAQESPIPDSTAFLRGQWAAQFGGGLSLATLGVLRFTSPRSAWLFDVQLSGGHSHNTVTVPTVSGDTTLESFTSDARISFRVGRRFYRGARRGGPVTPFVGVGVLGGFTHSASGDDSGGFESNGWTAGTFGEVGGLYRVTDHLSLGAGADVGITYGRSKARSVSPFSTPSRQSRWNYAVSAPNLRFVATLFF